MLPTGEHDGIRIPCLAVLLTVLMLLSAVAAPGMVLAESDDHSLLEDGLDEADDVYIDEDGNAILVYGEDESDDDFDEIHLGGHVAEGILYMFAADSHDVDEAEEFENVEMDASAILSGDVFEADGSLSLDRPEEIQELDVHLAGEVSEDANEMSAEAYAEFVDESGMGAFVGNAYTTGDVTVAHDAFSLQADGMMETGFEPRDRTERYEVSIEDSEDAYSAEITQHEFLNWFEVEQWESEEAAEEVLNQQFGMMAQDLGGEAVIDIEHYEFEEEDEEYWLELEYTVDIEGVDDGLSMVIAQGLMEDPDLDLDEEQAMAIGEAVTDIELSQFDVLFTDDGATMEFDIDVQIDGFDELMFATMEALEDEFEEMDEEFQDIEDFAEMYEAQAAAEMVTHFTWDIEVESTADPFGEPVAADSGANPDPESIVVDASLGYETENWDAFIEELDDRGIETADYNVVFDFSAQNVDDQIHAEGEFVLEQDDLVDAAMDGLTEILHEEADDESAAEFVRMLEETNLEIAKVDFSMDDQEVTIEAGAQIDDLDAFFQNADVVPDEFVVDDPDGDLYIYVTDIVDDPDAVEAADLESFSFVGSDTEIHEPGEWDEEFPRFDVETAADSLDVTLSEYDEGGDDGETEPEDDVIPGFGLAAALMALLAGGLFAREYQT